MEAPLDILVDETFPISGRGTVVAGTIRGGVLRVGDLVEIVRADGATTRAKVSGIDFLCGPDVRPNAVGLLLAPHDDAYVLTGCVITGLA